MSRTGSAKPRQIGRLTHHGGTHPAQFGWGLLRHPLFTGSVALLAVNDHVLKGRAPGWFTGKASDFAGVAVVALLAGIVVRWPAAVAATAVAWIALKTLPEAAGLAAPVLGGPTRTDPTDLVALLALWPVGLVLARRGVPSVPDGRALARSVSTTAILATTVLTVTATSCESAPRLIGFEPRGDGILVAVTANGSSEIPTTWAESRDGGLTWIGVDHQPVATDTAPTEVCRADGRCFRVVPDDGVDELIDDEWTRSFGYSDDEIDRMKARGDSCSGDGWPADLFSTITTVSSAEGQTVVVAMGTQGVLRMDPVDERWERIGVAGLDPTPIGGPLWLRQLYWMPLLLALGTPVLLISSARRRAVGRGVLVMVLAGGGLLVLAMVAGFLLLVNADYAVAGPTIAGLSLAVFAASLVVSRRSGPRLPPPPGPTGGSLPPPPAPR